MDVFKTKEGYEFILNYAEKEIKSALYQIELSCVHHNTASDDCGEFQEYSFESPVFRVTKSGRFFFVVFPQQIQKLPYVIFYPLESGLFEVEDSGIAFGNSEQYIKEFENSYK